MAKPFAKSKIHALYALGTLLIVAAVGIVIFIVKRWYSNDTTYYYGYASRNTVFDWWHWVLILAVGIALCAIAYGRNTYWYGEVVGKSTVAGHRYDSYRYGDTYYLLVTGANRVGKTITECICVQPKTYYDYNVGDRWHT
jgi:hypothetical protein